MSFLLMVLGSQEIHPMTPLQREKKGIRMKKEKKSLVEPSISRANMDMIRNRGDIMARILRV